MKWLIRHSIQMVFLLICNLLACNVTTEQPQAEQPQEMGLQNREPVLHVVPPSKKLDEIVRLYKGYQMYSRGCLFDSCPIGETNKAHDLSATLGECLRCAGYLDDEKDLGDDKFGVCHVFCEIKNLPYTRVHNVGCVCGDMMSHWSREHCAQTQCDVHGFKWMSNGYWTVVGG